MHLLSLSPPRPTDALDLIEIYITSIPYATSPSLHGLAAICALGKSLDGASQAGQSTRSSPPCELSRLTLLVLLCLFQPLLFEPTSRLRQSTSTPHSLSFPPVTRTKAEALEA